MKNIISVKVDTKVNGNLCGIEERLGKLRKLSQVSIRGGAEVYNIEKEDFWKLHGEGAFNGLKIEILQG